MLTDMRHYCIEEDSKENSLRYVIFEMLGGFKWLKFRGRSNFEFFFSVAGMITWL